MPRLLEKSAESLPSQQDRMIKLIVAALNNELPGATVVIKDGRLKVTAKTGATVITAEMRQLGTGVEQQKTTFPQRRKGDSTIVADAKALRAAGFTQQEIADRLGRSQAAISGYLKK